MLGGVSQGGQEIPGFSQFTSDPLLYLGAIHPLHELSLSSV